MPVFRLLALLCLGAVAADAIAYASIRHWTTDNGARVYFAETHQIPMVQFTVGFDAGSARDPSSREGLSSLVARMVEEGAAAMDGEDIAAAFEAVGADFGAAAGRDIALFELRSLVDKPILDAAAEVFGAVLGSPTFPEEAFDRVRQRVLVGLKRREQSPGSVASRAFYRALYTDHPYAHSPSGEEDSVRAASRQDLVDFHREFFVGSNAVVVIVGALTPAEARRRAEQMVGGLPRGTAPPRVAEIVAATKRGQRTMDVDFPASQTHIIMGQIGIGLDDPDYFPLLVGNHILGGNGLISRLATSIREERGLAYSVYSAFDAMKAPGPFIINLQTRNEQSDEAETLAMETLRRFVDEGPDPEELEAAKGNIIGGFPLRLSSNAKLADNILSIAFHDLPLDYLETYPDRIRAVGLEQVKDAFRRRVNPENFLVVRVGGS